MSRRDQIDKAVCQLNKSSAGRNAIKSLLAWLEDDGLTLDGQNQNAVFLLLESAWGGFAGTTRDLMRETIEP